MGIRLRMIFTVAAAVAGGASVSAQSGAMRPQHLDRGVELFEAGQYRAAQTELSRARDESAAANDRMYADYLYAQCAAKLAEPRALDVIRNFLLEYPGSMYAVDMHLAAAGCLFDAGRYGEAVREFDNLRGQKMSVAQRDEFSFKIGYAHFMQGDNTRAYNLLRQVGPGSYSHHAQYYTAYINYTEGNYTAAKSGFAALASDETYGRLAPFYLLQIEFLEGNYDYVTANGDALLRQSQGERTAEIARILAGSWFHKENYVRALNYIDTFRSEGGRMGRDEYYIAGYSEYMQGRPERAVAALANVVGPADKLSQNAAYHMAACYLELGDKRAAAQSFSIAAHGEGDAGLTEDALFNYGKLQFELGGGVFNEAINVLTRYVEEYPRSSRVGEAREYLASAYYNSRNYEAAYEAIKQIPNPDNTIRTAFQKIAYFRAMEQYAEGNSDAAYAMLEEALQYKFNPKYTALTQFWMGEILYARGEYDRAARMYREYMALSNPAEREYRMALYNLGYTAFNEQKWASAREWFGKFNAAHKARDSYRADVMNRLGDIDFANREFWRAIEKYDEAAKYGTPERYYAQFRRAVMLGHVDRRDRKIESLNDIIRRGEGDHVADAMYELGRTYIIMERFRDAASVMKRFTDEHRNSPMYTAALSDLGLIYQNLNDNKTALTYYKRIVEDAPNSPQAKDAMLAIQNIYVDMNDTESYFAFASRSGMETDVSVVARDSLAWAAAERTYTVAANVDNQVRALRDYLDKYPRGAYRPNALYYMGGACESQGRAGDAIAAYAELGEMYQNEFTVRGLEKLGALYAAAGRHPEAADTYKQLSLVAVNPSTVSAALEGYLGNTVAAGDPARIIVVADDIQKAVGVSSQTKRDALFAKAEALDRQGRAADALAIYRELATESRTAAGARSMLRVIESQYAAGNHDAAMKMVMQMSEQSTPHRYELGRAFLVLGDIYAAKGDTFQARATLQSIIDGYSPADDGVVAAAREKIGKLK